ncbi:hypothetical protein GCM10010251_46940 [Streptomyces aurantiogriseus]|uniref:Uncharacterized protein n=1 Tax=Streptomyces aurantiogriseus TaxID=66870 RepID=A0A918CKE8_9ACTN|nr:hypothetical protein GCM10010251_46940 [Streptomyces aurantiogriseus]
MARQTISTIQNGGSLDTDTAEDAQITTMLSAMTSEVKVMTTSIPVTIRPIIRRRQERHLYPKVEKEQQPSRTCTPCRAGMLGTLPRDAGVVMCPAGDVERLDIVVVRDMGVAPPRVPVHTSTTSEHGDEAADQHCADHQVPFPRGCSANAVSGPAVQRIGRGVLCRARKKKGGGL